MTTILELGDARCGLVSPPTRVEVEPPWHCFHAHINEPLWGVNSTGPRVGVGCGLSEERARAAAVGEAAERYSSMHPDPTRIRRTSWRELTTAGHRAVPPRDLQLPTAAGDAALDADHRCGWVLGADRLGPIWVPSALAWTEPGAHARTDDGLPFNAPGSTGTALAGNRQHAQRAAFAEALERHALATAWHARQPFIPIPAPAGFHAWRVPNRWCLPVVLASHDASDQLATGCALGADLDTATIKACAEAVMMRHTLSLLSRRPPPRPAHAADVLDLVAHARWCADDAISQQQWERLRVSSGPAPQRHPTSLEAAWRDVLQPITVDLTTGDLAERSWHVVRVIVPGLRPCAPAGYRPPPGGLDPLPQDPCTVPIPHM